MRYAEYPPPKELAAWIECIWVFESNAFEDSVETIVADGFPELIVHFGCPYAEPDQVGNLQNQSQAVLSGQITGPLVLHSPGNAGIVSIRFKPSGLVPFTRTPMRLLTNSCVPADQLFEDVDQYIEKIQMAVGDRQRFAVAINFLMDSLSVSSARVPVRFAVKAITDSGGGVAVEWLAKRLNMGRRNLELQFLRDVGVSPKQFCRIIRFRRAYDLLSEGNSQAVAVALEAGFFDQSHLIRDFKKFAGASPTEFLQSNSGLSHAMLADESSSL